jgi:hypothetical protein
MSSATDADTFPICTQLVACIGATNAGKSSFIAQVKALQEEQPTCSFTTIEVGKMLRAKYGEAYFKGQAAPDHTEAEAWQLCEDAVRQAVKEEKRYVFIDGQPRRLSQLTKMEDLSMWLSADWHARCHEWYLRHPNAPTAGQSHQNPCSLNLTFLHLYASRDARKERIAKRDSHDADKLALSMARLDGDIPALFDILSRLSDQHHEVTTLDTSLFDGMEKYRTFIKQRFLHYTRTPGAPLMSEKAS